MHRLKYNLIIQLSKKQRYKKLQKENKYHSHCDQIGHLHELLCTICNALALFAYYFILLNTHTLWVNTILTNIANVEYCQ